MSTTKSTTESTTFATLTDCNDLLVHLVRHLQLLIVERCDGDAPGLEWTPAATSKALRDATAAVQRERTVIERPAWSLLGYQLRESPEYMKQPSHPHDPMWAMWTAHGLLVSEYGSAQLKLFSPEFEEIRCVELDGRPTGLACSGDTAWAGSDSEHCVYKIQLPELTVSLRSETTYGIIEEDQPRQQGVLARVFGIAHFEGMLYITDADNGRIVVLDADTLAWCDSFGAYGTNEALPFYGMAEPTGVTIHTCLKSGETQLVVCDHTLESLVVFLIKGGPRAKNRLPGPMLIDELRFPSAHPQGIRLSKPWDVASYRGHFIVTQEPHPCFRGEAHLQWDVEYKFEHSQMVVLTCQPWDEMPVPDVQQVIYQPRVRYEGNPHPTLVGRVVAMPGYLRPGYSGIAVNEEKREAVVVDSTGSIHGFRLAL
jgi:hypothetical protein